MPTSVRAKIDRIFERLSYGQRKRMPDSEFAEPSSHDGGKGGYPIEDRAHGANALARSSGKPNHAAIKRKVCARYPGLPSCKEAVAARLDGTGG